MKKITISILLTSALFGQNLQDIYDLAKVNDPSFQAAKEALKAGEEVEYQGYSVLMPKITLNGQAGNYDLDITYKKTNPMFASGTQKYYSNTYSANLIWPILRKDSIDLYRGSKVLLRQAKAAFDSAKQNLILKVSSAYFDYLLALENMEHLKAQKKSAQNAMESAKLNFKLGNATAIETSEAEARYDAMVARELGAVQEIEVKKNILENISGESVGQIDTVGDMADDSMFQIEKLETLYQKVESNPNLKKAKEQASFAALEYERSKAKFFPSFDLVAQRGKSTTNGSLQGIGSEQTTSYVGVAMEFNIFNGGYDYSKTKEYLANKNRASYEYEALRRENQNQTLQGYLALTVGVAQMKASKKAMESAKMSLESFKIGEKIGLRNSSDLLSAEQSLFEAQKNYSASKYSLIMSLLKLKALTNELDDNNVANISKLTR